MVFHGTKVWLLTIRKLLLHPGYEHAGGSASIRMTAAALAIQQARSNFLQRRNSPTVAVHGILLIIIQIVEGSICFRIAVAN